MVRSGVPETAARSGRIHPVLPPAGRVRNLSWLWRQVRARRHCTLTAITPYGEPSSHRLVLQNRCLRAGEPLWFVIERNGELAFDLTHRPQVRLRFELARGDEAQVQGEASIVCDLERAEYLPGVPSHLAPDGPRDERLPRQVVLRVDVTEVRHLPALQPATASAPAPGSLWRFA